jgi:hypothetical protein
MDVQDEQCWHLCVSRPRRLGGSDLDRRISRALASPPVAVHRALLERAGRAIDPDPLLAKYLAGPYLRLFFAVTGGGDEIRLGTVVAIALLFDPPREETLCAHPVFAGPDVSPMLKRLDGPVAQPSAQEGRNGELATRRFLAHKRVLWERFEEERGTKGRAEAGRRWREGFLWALVRLHFCERCPGCRWGCPFFDGPAAEHHAPSRPSRRDPYLPAEMREIVAAVTSADLWQLEVAYVRRGGFVMATVPRLARHLDHRFTIVVLPTTVEFLHEGAIVGVAAWYDRYTHRVRYVHVLTAGSEPEPILVHGDRELGLPSAGHESQVSEDYVAWRASAWRRFWLDELEHGIGDASAAWLDTYWDAVRRLFGGARTSPAPSDSRDLVVPRSG